MKQRIEKQEGKPKKPKVVSLKKSTKLKNLYSEQEKKEKAQINKIKNKMRVITTGLPEIKRIIREYCVQLLCQQITKLRRKGHLPKKDINY